MFSNTKRTQKIYTKQNWSKFTLIKEEHSWVKIGILLMGEERLVLSSIIQKKNFIIFLHSRTTMVHRILRKPNAGLVIFENCWWFQIYLQSFIKDDNNNNS